MLHIREERYQNTIIIEECLDSNNVTTTKTFGDGGNSLIIEEWKKTQKLTETHIHSYEWTKSIGISVRAERDLKLSTQLF